MTGRPVSTNHQSESFRLISCICDLLRKVSHETFSHFPRLISWPDDPPLSFEQLPPRDGFLNPPDRKILKLFPNFTWFSSL